MSRLFSEGSAIPVTLVMAENLEDIDHLEIGTTVKVSGLSKGKGFQGVVKRHGHSGGPATHGHRHVLRTPGSVGGMFPQHTRKGRKLPGRAGQNRVTVPNLEVVDKDKETGVIAIKGALPGSRNSRVEIIPS